MHPTLDHVQSKSEPLQAGLYLVATPIGNLEDITLRALRILSHVDKIACEDTRVSQKLLSHYMIQKPLLSYHEHNADHMRPKLLGAIQSGEAIAFITDAGMPLVSDPGYKLVRNCIEAGVYVTVIPGPSSSLAALALSGLAPDRFFFQGFLPSKSSGRQKILTELLALQSSLIFFESPHRILDTLHDARAILGDRRACIVREITKLFEERIEGSFTQLIDILNERTLKGEIVLVIEGYEPQEMILETLQALVKTSLATYSLKETVSRITKMHTVAKSRVYDIALSLQKEKGDDVVHTSDATQE